MHSFVQVTLGFGKGPKLARRNQLDTAKLVQNKTHAREPRARGAVRAWRVPAAAPRSTLHAPLCGSPWLVPSAQKRLSQSSNQALDWLHLSKHKYYFVAYKHRVTVILERARATRGATTRGTRVGMRMPPAGDPVCRCPVPCVCPLCAQPQGTPPFVLTQRPSQAGCTFRSTWQGWHEACAPPGASTRHSALRSCAQRRLGARVAPGKASCGGRHVPLKASPGGLQAVE